jgi:hypothetical protein
MYLDTHKKAVQYNTFGKMHRKEAALHTLSELCFVLASETVGPPVCQSSTNSGKPLTGKPLTRKDSTSKH